MIGVAIMGCGIVGSGVARMLTENSKEVCHSAGAEVRLKAILDVREVKTSDNVRYVSDFAEIEEDPEIKIVVETIGGENAAYHLTKRALESGRHVATSNKALMTAHGDELTRIARENGVRYLYEASVGGGVPVVRSLSLCLSGNRITSIDGIINGSTNYLLTRMDDMGLSFPAALSEAQKLGFVEGNPDADIEGWDPRRKLTILAHVAFGSDFGDGERVPTEGIGRVTDRDLVCARALGGKIKLIAHAERDNGNWTGWVSPTLIPKGHPFYQVNGSYNAIRVQGNFVGDITYSGQGAGSEPTASAVVGDVIDIARQVDAVWQPAEWAEEEKPRFRLVKGEVISLMLRVEGENLDSVRAIIAEMMPGANVREAEGMLAVVTPEEKQETLRAQIDQIRTAGVHTGIPVRVMQ